MRNSQKAVSPELGAVEIHGMTRSSFILRGAMTAGAAYGATAVAPFVSNAFAATASSDLDILNFALTLEYLETNFYQVKAKAVGLSGDAKSLAAMFGAEETQHVVALKGVAMKLGTPAAKPTGKFPVTSASQVATLAATVENLGAAAYLGQAPLIQSKEVLAAALSIHTIEARHAATLNLLTKKSPTPNGAFGSPATMQQVLAAVKPFIA